MALLSRGSTFFLTNFCSVSNRKSSFCSDHNPIGFNLRISLTRFGVDVCSQNVPAGKVFQQETFGDTRGHGPFARPRRTHNNHTEDLVERHPCTVLLSSFSMPGCLFKVRRRKSFLDAQLDQVPLSSPRSVQRCTTWGWLVQPVDAHSAFPSLPSVLQRDKRGRGGTKEERRRRGGGCSNVGQSSGGWTQS